MPIDPRLREQAEDARQRLRRRTLDTLSVEYVSDYVRDLLGLELGCARSDPQPPQRLPPEPAQGGTLVLLVGFSIEPLLQSISAYKPDEVVLVMNKEYGRSRPAKSFAELFWCGVRQLHPRFVERQIRQAPLVILDRDQPAYVFRALRRALIPRLRRQDRLIVDITGGKKSMVAGALLFGAFAGVPISYVDFDEYDPQSRAPLGYTCRIGELPNPYEIFRLKDWDRVRELYERHFFRSAGILLENILPSMPDWFEDGEIEAARRLRAAMAMYELWDNGDFSRAWQGGASLRCPLPTAVEVLGQHGYWPHGNNAEEILQSLDPVELGPQALYLDFDKLAVYVYDELAKISRLIDYNEDWRSALLRAVGLTEMLLRSRMLLLLERNQLEVAGGDSESWQSSGDIEDALRKLIRAQIISTATVYPFVKALRYDPGGPSEVRRRHAKIEVRTENAAEIFLLRRTSDAPRLEDDAVLGAEAKLRNKATHFCLSVPEGVARKALHIAETSARQFFEDWVKRQDITLKGRLPWQALCDCCGVDFLAPAKEEATDAVAAGSRS